MTDRLKWWEDIPLGLALLAQSYVVGLWYYASISGASWWADLTVAIGAGLSLDLIVVTTVMGRRQGRSSGWSWATSFGAFCCSALIALDRYGWEWRSLLHVAFPLVVFLYSQHLATPRKTSLQTLPERLSASEPPDQAIAPALIVVAQEQAVLQELSIAPLELESTPLEAEPVTQAVLQIDRYSCPHCNRPLATKQARGAAVKNGYCLECKAERKAA